ncbi:MAG: hypothetical protein R2780_12310 [Crocinitomicaceae bacterium]|nr:hypothetical protein [Crocinitomicaceae bacterium]
MKKSLLILSSLALSLFSIGQTQIDNPGFEDGWETPEWYMSEPEPLNWSSLKTADALGAVAPVVAFQSTSPHSGTYCIKLVAKNVPPVANGLLTNGRVHADFNPSNGYVWTETSDNQWYQTFTDRPDSLTFWIKHQPTTGDKSKVEVILHDNSQTGQLPHTGVITHWVGKARADISTTYTSWTRLSVPFNYFNSNSPDYILVTCAAGDSTIALDGTTMYLDDFALIYNPLLVSIAPSATQNINIGVNGTMLTVTEQANAGVTGTISREWKWSTTSGTGYQSFTGPETGTTYTPNFATADIYYVVCETDFGGTVVTSNEVEIVVTDPGQNTVTISPSAPQTLLTDQTGTMLTATESPSSASSREWKWSTTSGTGYQSFTSAETGINYTPLFSNLGTYYIICESDFSGDVQTSNEVIINVPSSAGIDENDFQFTIYTSGENIEIKLNTIENNPQFNLYTIDGKFVYNSTLTSTTSQHPLPNIEGVYVYQVIVGNRIITNKIKL